LINRPRFGRGLSAERTALAWRRSLAGLLGIMLLLARGTLTRWPPLAGAIAISVVGGILLTSVIAGQRRYWTLRQPAPGPLKAGGIAALTGAVLAAAALGTALLIRF
jgi:uncharacterized membrane protein YdcZ (DUF606 family)